MLVRRDRCRTIRTMAVVIDGEMAFAVPDVRVFLLRKICQRSFHKPPLLGKSHTFLRIGLKGRAAGLDLHEMDPVEVLADYVQFQMALTAVAPQYAVPPGFQIAAYRLLSYASGLLSAAILFHISRN